MHLGKGFCACDFMQGKKSFQHFVRKETLQSGLSYCLHENKKSADTFGDPRLRSWLHMYMTAVINLPFQNSFAQLAQH